MIDRPSAMNCPRCPGAELVAGMTKQGVEVDLCRSCGGVWLDKGEISYFARSTKTLVAELARAKVSPGVLPSPVTGRPMQRLLLFDGIEVDRCQESEGLWLDKGELAAIAERSAVHLQVEPEGARQTLERRPDGGLTPESMRRYARDTRPLPNLFLRSMSLLVLLYGMLTALLIGLVELGYLTDLFALVIGVGFALIQFGLGPFLMDLSLSWFYSLDWTSPDELPPHLREFIAKVCQQRRMRFPRMGVINDGAPNAFTYGHMPNNARIVITRGLYDLLDERELEAVVAHEIGHAAQWDMLLLTAAQLVPLVAFYIYKAALRARGKGRDNTAGARIAVAVGAYLIYIVSEYVVLWLSRTREYKADNFAGRVTGNPNALASALVKIGYGLAGRQETPARGREHANETERSRRPSLEPIGALGIFDGKAARALAIAGGGTATLDPAHLKGAMRWDLWNPWAKFYELQSTHPLIANRLDYLSRQAAAMNQPPLVIFDERRPESYWDEFFVDLTVLVLPYALPLLVAGLLAASGQPARFYWLALSAFGLGMGLRTWFSYRGGDFPELTVAGLLRNVKVSGVRPVPCTVRGEVIGRGQPGLIWSEDAVIRDRTGLIFLDYRQPLRIWEFLFGLMRRSSLDGANVIATGWYRRAPVPFVELRTLNADGVTRGCYVMHVKWFVATLLAVLGLFLWMRAGTGA
jgi:Zn-dependent protease with chaperone function/Zn-finger nucleic acid-binding protein